MAATEQFRPRAWQRLAQHARWLLLPALAIIGCGLYLGEGDTLTLPACIWQFPLVALGMSLLLVCAVSERLPFCWRHMPGAEFLASIAYSVYLSHKLAIHWALAFCASHHLALDSPTAIVLNLGVITLVGAALFFTVERPFLQLRRRATKCLPTATIQKASLIVGG